MKKYITENGLSDTVCLLGKVNQDEIWKYYKLADIFVFSSKSETQGMVLLEAMAGSCPVVAVQSSGVDDMITNGHNGFKTNDDVKEWASRIRFLMENKDKRMNMAGHAHEFAHKYTIRSVGKKVLELYYIVMSGKKR